MSENVENPRNRPAVSKNEDIPVLEGWVGLTEAGELTGVTRQQSYKRARTGYYKTLHRIGNSTITVVALSEIEDINGRKTAISDTPEESAE